MNREEMDRILKDAERPDYRIDEARMDQIRSAVTSQLKPARPLPRNPVLVAISLAAFALIVLLGSLDGGHMALTMMSGPKMVAYFGALLLLAVLFSFAIVDQIIPGSKRRINPITLLAGAALLLVVLTPVLFQNFELRGFVEGGWPCLKFGTFFAILGGALGFRLARGGFLTSPMEASLLLGCFAGLSGATALACVCPFFNAPHILVWHFGTMVVGTAAGAGIGLILEWQASRKKR